MPLSRITVSGLESRKHVRDFLDVPQRVYRDDRAWIAPLRTIEKNRLGPSGHPFYRHGFGKFWVAYRGGVPIGRIGATVNKLHVDRHGEPVGHIAMLEGLDDSALFDALLDTAEAWLVAQGMRAVTGPFNLSMHEEPGLLVDGFDTPPTVLLGHARPYYAAHLARRGYRKEIDLYAFVGSVYADLDKSVLEQTQRLADRAGVTIRRSTRATFHRDLHAAFQLYNEAWIGNWGHIPMTEEEINESVRALWVIAHPEMLSFAEHGKRVVGAFLAMPNMNEWLSGINGRLLPFGWSRLLRRWWRGQTDLARLMIMGVSRDFQGRTAAGAIPLLMANSMRKLAPRYRPRRFEGSWILETNTPVLRFCERAGMSKTKTYRIYRRNLVPSQRTD